MCRPLYRTKWKRQNQLRLDQLRQQQSAEPGQTDTCAEYGQHHQHKQQHRLHAAEHHGMLGRQEHGCRVQYVPAAAAATAAVVTAADHADSSQTTTGTADVSAANSPSPTSSSSAAAAAAAAAFIGAPYPGAANGARWNFLTTAAAIVRNVSYVHGCHI